MRRFLPLLLLVVVGLIGAPSQASTPLTVSMRHPSATWHGTLRGAAPLSCGNTNLGCDERDVLVDAAKGTWITVSADATTSTVRVTSGGAYVGSGGQFGDPNPDNGPHATTTFQQLRSGRVSYHVAVGTYATVQAPATPVGSTDSRYTGSVQLAGKAFDRGGECGATTGIEHLQDADHGELLHVSVLLVSAPADVAEVQRVVVPGLIDAYSRISVALRVSVQGFPLRNVDTYPYQQVRRAFQGVRPAGVDVVHVITDAFNGGFADCIGGIVYPEKAFSNGGLHYFAAGSVVVPTVAPAAIAAHEIGHLLGAQHQQANCVEALPQLAVRPAKDGSAGPCTIMSPAAVQGSETFSTLERATIRSYVRRFARG